MISNVLAYAAQRDLGDIINKCLKRNSIMYNTYTQVYNRGVVPIMGYASDICSYKPQVVHNKAQQALLGVHQYASNVVVNGNIGSVTRGVRRKLHIIRL